jgi:cell wall-associated NlpC family hydrolase
LRRVSLFVMALLIVFALFPSGVFASDKTSLLEKIEGLIGTPYKYGGTTTKGFDCSGFIGYLFKQYEITLPRTSKAQAKVGEEVKKADLQYGDLVFFKTNGKSISHVGVFIGDGEFAHSSTSNGITITSMNDSYYKKRYVTARRLTNDQNYALLVDDLNDEVEEVEEELEDEVDVEE